MHKTQIRKHISYKKKCLTQTEISSSPQNFWIQLSKHNAFIASTHIAFYYPFKNELDVMLALRHAIQAGKKCYLPYIENSSNTLKFIYFDDDTSLTQGPYGITYPTVTSSSLFIAANALELVIMPVVAIDKYNNRVGMGKGYYDKTFSFKKVSNNKPILIAACYEFQLIPNIAPDPWDIQLDDYIIA